MPKQPTATDERSRTERSRRAWFCRLGAGLLVAGAAMAVVGLTTEVRPARADFPGLAIVGAIAVAAALIVVVVLSIRVRRDETDDDTFRLRRRWAEFTALLAALAAGYTWWQVSVDLGGGMITRAMPLLAAGLSLATIGAVLIAVAPNSPGPGRKGTNVGVAAVSALTSAAVAFAVAVVIEGRPLDHTTATAETEPAITDVVPEQVIWQWHTPADEQIQWTDIAPTPAGVAVRVEDGIVALDGETGEEIWRYRVSGARAQSIGASPSGEWVMATFASPEGDGGVRVMALDGLTGEIGFDELASVDHPWGGVKLDLTDDVLIGGSPEDGRFTGFALEDGGELWTWHVPDDCYLSGSSTLSFAARTTVVLPLVCADDEQQSAEGITGEVTFLGLDSQTGSEAWRVADEFTDTEPLNDRNSSLYHQVFIDADIRVSGDGALASLWWQARGPKNPFTHHLIDTATGEELPADEDALRTTSFVRSIMSESPPGTINYFSADDEYVLAPFNDPDNPRAIGSRCAETSSPWGAGYADAWVNVGDALVELCAPVNFEEGTPFPIGVTPWDSPDQAYDFEVDLGPRADEPDISGTYLAKFPAVTVAVSGSGTQLTALGQP